MSLKVGEPIRIESYKHGNRFHRMWKESIVLKIDEPMIVANCDAQVVEATGDEHIFPGLVIGFFSKIDWFHTLILFDSEDRVDKFYVNIASPYQLDERTKILQYVDYDLDLILNPDCSYTWVDQEEYQLHSVLYQYPESVKKRIAKEQMRLERKIKHRQPPFTIPFAEYWRHQYRLISYETCREQESTKHE